MLFTAVKRNLVRVSNLNQEGEQGPIGIPTSVTMAMATVAMAMAAMEMAMGAMEMEITVMVIMAMVMAHVTAIMKLTLTT